MEMDKIYPKKLLIQYQIQNYQKDNFIGKL